MIERHSVCVALATVAGAVLFSVITVFWSSGQPFEVVDAKIVERAAAPDDVATFRMSVRRVNRSCRGVVKRVFIDSSGHPFQLQPMRVFYGGIEQQGSVPIPVIERYVRIPEKAADGEGTYVEFPTFWCNPMQALYPIEMPPIRATVRIVRQISLR